MPKSVPISTYLIAKSEVQEDAMREWLGALGVDDARVNEILTGKSSAETLIEAAGRRCYMSFQPGLNPNVTRIRKEIGEYIENILKSKHGSVMEHASYTFAIEGVSRVFTGEMNRHRVGMAISEGSMRFIRFEDIGYWVPTSIQTDKHSYMHAALLNEVASMSVAVELLNQWCTPHVSQPLTDALAVIKNRLQDREAKLKECTLDLDDRKHATKNVFFYAFRCAELFYARLMQLWSPELATTSAFKDKKNVTSMMRRIIPMGVATGGVWTGNIRALRHICEMRCSPAAEEEILLVVTSILNTLKVVDPNIFGDFTTDEMGFSAPRYSKV